MLTPLRVKTFLDKLNSSVIGYVKVSVIGIDAVPRSESTEIPSKFRVREI